MDKILLVDGNSIANRAYYALPFFVNHEGKPSGAVFGFANILIKLLQEEKPNKVVVAFDHARKTFRNEIYSEYKMQRKPSPSDLIEQMPIIKKMLDVMQIQHVEIAGIEADDIIGTLSKNYPNNKIILSGDRDLLQLIDDKTEVWLTKKGVSEVDKVDENRLIELFNLKPYQIIELKGLMGDSSDNIPGVKGIGEKTALSLLEKYQTVDNIYNNIEDLNGKLREHLESDKDNAFMSKTLATIKRDCDIDLDFNDCNVKFPFNENAYQFFKEWDFNSLMKNQKLFISNYDINKDVKIEKNKLTFSILNEFKKDFKKISTFCYDLKQMEFYFNDKLYFLEKNYTLFEEPLSLQEVCLKLKDVFEDNKILKITKQAKDDLHFLKQLDINLNNYYDLSVADYLLSAGIKSNIDNIQLIDYYQKMCELKNELTKKSLDKVFFEIEYPLINTLYKMEDNGFKINERMLNDIGNEFNAKINKIVSEIYLQAGEEFNINSPKQVAGILFDKLGIQAYNNKKQSTSANILEDLRYIPIVDNILTYRKYSKLVNTYIEVYKDLCRTSGDIIHTTFNQTLTSTGRLSSSEPNLQNIPTRDDEGKVLRKIFISKFLGGKIISADYNQIELRLLADMSGEEGLISAYQKGEDIHALTASHIFNKPISEITPAERSDAKSVNFGIIYGISDFGLSQNIKSSRKAAREFINSYFEKYPKVKEFMDNNVKTATERGYAQTLFGRTRQIPELSSSKYQTRTFGERVAMNMPLQGTASDIIKLAMLNVDRAIAEKGLKSQLILQIHDELIVDTYPGEEDEIKEILKREMENVTHLKVPLIVSIGAGDSLYDCK